MSRGMGRLADAVELGGPVVALLLALSAVAVAVALYKVGQFLAEGVGRDAAAARHRRRLIETLGGARGDAAEAQAELALGRLESGFRLLDAVVQVAPLLGLFGTVLGMIEAFRTLQAAGAAVDPAALAGGIWVALTTTAAGLAVAIPTSLALTWLEARLSRERLLTAAALVGRGRDAV